MITWAETARQNVLAVKGTFYASRWKSFLCEIWTIDVVDTDSESQSTYK